MTPPHQRKSIKSQENKAFLLNPAQRSAAEAPITPLLIVAGAGTGKTRTLTSRIIHLIEQGISPERICAITFTNKAAKEMASRVAVSGPLIATFHSFGARILRKECRALGREPNFVIFDDHDAFDVLKKIIKNMALDPDTASIKKNKRYSPAFFSQKISELKNLDGAMETFRGPEEEKTLIARVFGKYEESLARNNAFDFDDLIQKPVLLWKKYPALLRKYQTQFDAILVDEYQDINPKQYELVKLLAGEHRNLSVVGDDEQTIYSWRHADIKTFLNFDKEWHGAKIFFLEENYRSTGNIIRAASAVAQNNKFRTPKKLWTGNEDGELITLFEAWGENDEAAWIADEIKKEPETARKEIAILYRTNAQSRAIEQALIRESIPYQIFGGLKFYERREVKDAVAALRFASNDRDEVAKERLEKNLTKRKFALFKGRLGGLKEPKPTDIIKLFIDAFGYFEYLEGGFTNPDEREENIAELINFASEFKDLPELLERISLLQATDETKDLGKEKVNMMTIHLAKGLEFDRVFIAGAAEGLLPHIRSVESEAATEEERRLMYVAMTRARKKLSISFFGMPSRFLAEIPEDCIALTITSNTEDDGPSAGHGKGRSYFHDESDFEENVVEF